MAMILPLPVSTEAADQLTFIDLSGCSMFFPYIQKSFGLRSRGGSRSRPKLEVIEVGSFEASFVPTLHDFDRLDERFRLDGSIWSQLPKYADYGFAVFKMKSGDHRLHPMAFMRRVSIG
jgi:hypothetical protein